MVSKLLFVTLLVTSSHGIGHLPAQSPLLGEPGKQALLASRVDDHAVASSDVDGDDDQDLLLAQEDGLRVHLNNGKGMFSEHPAGVLPDSARIVRITVGDFDGDGHQDLFCSLSIRSAGSLSLGKLYLNDGKGCFSDVSSTHLPQFQSTVHVWDSDVGDVNGDADLDIVVSYSKDLAVLHNDGSAHFSLVSQSIADTSSVALGDIDGDGDLDLVFAERRFGLIHRRTNGGLGSFSPGSVPLILNAAINPSRIWLKDIDSDGDVDLIGSHPGNPTVAVNDGHDRFTDVSAAWFGSQTLQARLVELTDIDGDQRPDLITTGLGSPHFLVNTGHSFRSVSPLGIDLHVALSAVATDLDGDCKIDVVLGTPFGHAAHVLFRTQTSQGGMHWLRANQREFDGHADLDSMFSADFDGDGTLDLITSEPDGEHLFANQRGLGFAEVEGFTLGIAPAAVVTSVGDLDGDGDPDLVVRGHQSSGMVFLNDGKATFTGQPIGANKGIHHSVLGDLDGDGDLDLVSDLQIFRNDGKAKFQVIGNVVSYGLGEAQQALADLDGDGDLDVLTARSALAAMINDGTGRFASGLLKPYVPASMVAPGDLDGDGDIDLVAADSLGVSLRINDGTGQFSLPVPGSLPVLAGVFRGLILLDIDSDGDQDIWLGRRGNRDVFLENDGKGQFKDSGDAWLGLDCERGTHGIAADFDDDGDLDLAVAFDSAHATTGSKRGLTVFRNRLRQIHLPELSRNGRTMRVDYYVSSGSGRIVFPWFDSGLQAAIVFPGIGMLHLDPSRMVSLAPVQVAHGTGVATVRYPLPIVALPGSLYLQAAVVHDTLFADIRLTGVIREVIVD